MSMSDSMLDEITSASLSQGVALTVRNREVIVALDGDKARPIRCEVVQAVEGATLRLAPGDKVLLWRPSADSRSGVVLGRLGPRRAPPEPEEKDLPDEIVLEARKGLVLRVGEGSITLRADGKILIKGKDLVSHARRMNRIKGGAVSLN